MEKPKSMAIQLRFVMLSPTVISRFLIIMSMLLAFSDQVGAEIIYPPTKIPFAKDVVIERYSQGQLLKLFRYTGKWAIEKSGSTLSLSGSADETPAYLISNDKLSKQPKSFKLDFVAKDTNKEFGFIYGDIGVVINNNKIYPAVFNSASNTLKASSQNGKNINKIIDGKSNTLSINTGYDPTGGPNQVCIIYINGEGLIFDYPDLDTSFGVYLSHKSSITINNIRWNIGSK